MPRSSPVPVPAPRVALAPQRRPGKERVAAILRAAAAVIAERGYEAATMAEIAARADTRVGSLYRFFPNKDALADALIARYKELIDGAFAAIEASVDQWTTEAFADALLGSLAELRGDTSAAVVALLDARPDGTARRAELHETMVKGLVKNLADALRRRNATVGAQKADAMAVVLLQNMKLYKSLDPHTDAAAIAELRAMTRLYLERQLGS